MTQQTMIRQDWRWVYWDRKLRDRFGPSRTLGTSDAALFFDVDQRTIQRWIQEGKLLAAGSDQETGQIYHARIPRSEVIGLKVARTPITAYPAQGELF